MITSFAVANGVSVPLTGWLMRRFGVVRTFVTLGRCCSRWPRFCAESPGACRSLILFRVFQGAVSGPMIPGSQALLLSLFPAGEEAARRWRSGR